MAIISCEGSCQPINDPILLETGDFIILYIESCIRFNIALLLILIKHQYALLSLIYRLDLGGTMRSPKLFDQSF